MVKIGSSDIDSYIHTLISQEFDHQPKKDEKGSEQPKKGTHDVPSSNRIQSENLRK